MSPPVTTRRHRKAILAVLSLSLLVISLDNTILNVALPSLTEDLHATSGELQWIVDAYMLVFAGLLLSAGSIGDRFGRKKALIAGLVVFGTGSALAALCQTPTELIAARAFMGIGGAFIMPTTLSLITNVFPPDERPRAIATWAAVSGLGIGIGPVVGGWLIEQFDWSAVFLVNIPIVLAAVPLAARLVPESSNPDEAHIDPPGALLSIAGLSTMVWAIIEAPDHGWTNPTILGAFALSAVLLLAFALWERHTATPMLELSVFKNPRFSAASVSITLVFFALMGMIYFLTQYLQLVMGYAPLEAGFGVVPVAVAIAVAGKRSARVTERFGAKVVVAGGLVTVAAGLVLMSAVSGTDASYWPLGIALAVCGLGMGCAMAPATDAVMGSLPLAHAGVGSATNDATRTIGGALGVAILGSLLTSSYGAQMDGATSGLPDSAASAATDGLGGAFEVAHGIGGASGDALAAAAQAAFVGAMDTAVLVAAGVAFAGAIIAALFLPAREGAPVAAPAARRITEPLPEGAGA